MTAEGAAAELASGCSELGLRLESRQTDRLLRFLDQLYLWNRSAGLTTIARADAVRLHLLDSLSAAELITASPSADLGSGGGVPGLVLAIACPATRFVLVESNRRKCSFLLETARVLELPNVEVRQADAATVKERFPIVLSRAFRHPDEYLRLARSLVTDDGSVVAMLASVPDPELRALATGEGYELGLVKRVSLPGGGEPRTIASFQPVRVSRET
jgi:16S rRNA (guanine527-N7)-methyltransferase